MENVIIVLPQQEAVEAGALMLRRGGNALDAAIACAFMQTVVDPQMASVAGFPDAFETWLARPTRNWMNRAEALVRTVRPSSDTICGARANELRQLVDSASVAMLCREL